MKKRSLVVLIIAAVLSVMCFTACGAKDTKTLESYVADNPDVQEQIDNAMNDNNVKVEIKGNDIVYTFDLATMNRFTEEEAKSDDVKTSLETALTDNAGTFGNISKTLESQSEITGISTVVNYTWGDEVLVTKTFTSADAPSSEE